MIVQSRSMHQVSASYLLPPGHAVRKVKQNSPWESLSLASSRVLGLGLCLLLVDWSRLFCLLAEFWVAETARWDMLCRVRTHTSHLTPQISREILRHAGQQTKLNEVLRWGCEPSLAGGHWHAGHMLPMLSGHRQHVYPRHGDRPTWGPVSRPGGGGGPRPPLCPRHHDGRHQVGPPPVGCEEPGGQSAILS